MFVFTAAVVGAGTMGGEIAYVIADADLPVVLTDVAPAAVDAALERARSLWQARVDAGKLAPAELERKLGLITGTVGYAGFADVDLAIEAVPEEMELKQTVLAEIDEVTPGHAIIASNTSALSITEMGEVTGRPDQVVGLHFLYPASTTRAVEVVQSEDTSPETVQAASTFVQAIRRMPVRCGDSPGFVVNRILTAAVSELWRAQVQSGLDVAEFDRAVTDADGSASGPFRVADVLGLDTVVSVAEHLRESYGARFHVHGGMRELVAAGHLGVKTGKGFYDHGR